MARNTNKQKSAQNMSGNPSNQPVQNGFKKQTLLQYLEKLDEKAWHQLSEEDIEMIDSIELSDTDSFNYKNYLRQAKLFDLAYKKISSEKEKLSEESKKTETLHNELNIQKERLNTEKQELELKSKQLKDDEQRLNQRLAEISDRERKIQEREANAMAGFLSQNQMALSQLEQQIELLGKEISQALSKKLEIQEQIRNEITEKYNKFEEEVFASRSELEDQKQQLLTEHKYLKQELKKLAIERELLDEDKQHLQQKVEEFAAAQLERLESQLRIWKERYEGSQQIQQTLERKLLETVNRVRAFGQRRPEEIIAELESLRSRNDELEESLAERPTQAAINRLNILEQEKEKWKSTVNELRAEVERLNRIEVAYQSELLDLATLKKQKEALETNYSRLSSALDELRANIHEGLEKEKERSPFEKCTQIDKDQRLQMSPSFLEDDINLEEFAEDLRHRIAISSPERDKRLYYSEEDIRAFLGGIAMSKLHILQGISGTGKTSLPIAFARALSQGTSNDATPKNYKLIEVQAGWRDRQDLIGYYNSFEGKFYETDFLAALYEAQSPLFKDQIYIIVLDEMNLSRPEHYFADFLSKLEQDRPEMRLNTDLTRPSPKLFLQNDTIIIPPNVWFIGTANQDETTLEFADKTYDRAHIMELGRSHLNFQISQPRPRNPVSYIALQKSFKEAQKQYLSQANKVFKFLNDHLSELLERKFNISWGNRLERQMKDYIPVVLATGGSLTEATDHILATKILRKVRDRYDTQVEDLEEIKNSIEYFWESELDKGEPVKSLKIIELELDRLGRER